MATQRLKLTRQQLSEFLGQDHESIKQFEKLFEVVDSISTSGTVDLEVIIGTVDAKANQALDALHRVESIVETIENAPPLGGHESLTNIQGGAIGEYFHITEAEHTNLGKVSVSKNSGATVGTRGRINLIEGSNVTLTISDDAGNDEVDVTIASSGGAGASWTEYEIDFGATPVYSKTFAIADGSVTGASKVIAVPCGKVATGGSEDDWEWDGLILAANPGAGTLNLITIALPGPVAGKRKIQYQVA